MIAQTDNYDQKCPGRFEREQIDVLEGKHNYWNKTVSVGKLTNSLIKDKEIMNKPENGIWEITEKETQRYKETEALQEE